MKKKTKQGGAAMAPAPRLATVGMGKRACGNEKRERGRRAVPAACSCARRAEDIIRAARAAQRLRAGVRAKVRLPDSLAQRARVCAAEARSETLADWINAVCRKFLTGAYDGVVVPKTTELATRDGSECLTVRAPAGMSSGEIRRAVEAGCVWCEGRRIPCTPQPCERYFLETE